MKLVRSTPNKLQCSTIHPISMARYSDRRFLDPFIAKREIPHTNVQKRTPKYIVFFDATIRARAVYR